MSKTIKYFSFALFGIFCFFAGVISESKYTSLFRNASYEISIRIYNSVRDEFGVYDKNKDHVIKTIHVWKDMDFAVVNNDGQKSIRVYE